MNKIRPRIKAYLIVVVLVIVQTFTARDAFFYSDDYTIMERFANGYQGIFEIGNGHFAPITSGVYYAMFALFGLNSYIPFLCLAGIFNLYFGISIVEFFLKKNYFSKLNIVIPCVFIVVPFAAQTIFWVAAAINLLVPSLLLNLLSCSFLKEKRTQKETVQLAVISFTIAIIGIGLGGYGLILIPAILLLNLKLRNLIGVGSVAILISIVTVLYLNSESATFDLFSQNFPLWLIKSYFEFGDLIIPAFPNYNFLTQLILFGIALSLILTIRNIFLMLNPIKMRNHDLAGPLITIAFITSITLMYRARGGIESFNASRYIVIMNFFLFSIMLLSTAGGLKNSKITEAAAARFERVFLTVLILVVISRVPLWHQSSLDVSYLGSINKELVIAELCTVKPSALRTEKISISEGLMHFPATLDNASWKDLKIENC
jgi:hypothetical protein